MLEEPLQRSFEHIKQHKFSLTLIALRRTKMQNQYILPETGFVRLPQVLNVFPVSKSTWWAGVKDGRFPQSVKLGPKITAWRVEDIRALILSSQG